MKTQYLCRLVIAILVLSTSSCTSITTPLEEGRVIVFVHWQEEGISGKKVEIIPTGVILYTNEHGIAEFALAPGTYTVRVYDIYRGGPACCLTVEKEITLKASATKQIKVVDCLMCV